MKEIMKLVSELVNRQLALVNINDGKTIYAINYITIDDDKLVCDTIASQTHFIVIDDIVSFKVILSK